jgi:hypothetical protein
MKKAINTRGDSTTRDMQADNSKPTRSFIFPKLRLTVEADSYANALAKAKTIIKKEKKG